MNKGPAPTTVDEYLAAVPAPAREALETLRRAIRQAAPEAEECISYRIPLYKLQESKRFPSGANLLRYANS